MEDSIKIDFKETGYEDVDCIHLTQDRDMWYSPVNTLINQ
jgi:hypothetical protein